VRILDRWASSSLRCFSKPGDAPAQFFANGEQGRAQLFRGRDELFARGKSSPRQSIELVSRQRLKASNALNWSPKTHAQSVFTSGGAQFDGNRLGRETGALELMSLRVIGGPRGDGENDRESLHIGTNGNDHGPRNPPCCRCRRLQETLATTSRPGARKSGSSSKAAAARSRRGCSNLFSMKVSVRGM